MKKEKFKELQLQEGVRMYNTPHSLEWYENAMKELENKDSEFAKEIIKEYSNDDVYSHAEDFEGKTEDEIFTLCKKYFEDDVKYFIDLSDYDKCRCIDVEPGIKTVMLGGFNEFCLYGVNECYPDVTEIHIAANVVNIEMENSLFPNVRKVVSESPYFQTRDILIKVDNLYEESTKRQTRYGFKDSKTKENDDLHDSKIWNRYSLLNAFVRHSNEVIDLKDVNCITSCSFAGCGAPNIVNSDDVTECEDSAFDKFYDDNIEKPVIVGTILVRYPELKQNMDFVFPDGKITTIANDALYAKEFPHRVSAVVKNSEQAKVVFNIDTYSFCTIQNIIFDTNDKVDFSCIDYRAADTSIKNIDIAITNPYYKVSNNIIYSIDGKTLIKYWPGLRNENVKIPEGVETIAKNAFSWNSFISKLQLPETLKRIEDNAFLHCRNLKTIYFPESLDYIGSKCFDIPFYTYGLVRIKSRRLPQNFIKAISLCGVKCFGKYPYVVIHLIDKNSNPLNYVKDCPALERLYLPGSMSKEKQEELNEYYNSHLFDTKYACEMWKYCNPEKGFQQKVHLAFSTFYYIDDTDEELKTYIKDNSAKICCELMNQLCKRIHKASFSQTDIQKRNIEVLKDQLLKLVNSGLLEHQLLNKLKGFFSLYDTSNLTNAVDKAIIQSSKPEQDDTNKKYADDDYEDF